MKLSWFLHENPAYDSRSPLVFDFNHVELAQANFATVDVSGFADGTLTIVEPSQALIQQAADTWLTKRVVAYDGAGNQVYEGYIAEISATLGSQHVFRSVDGYSNLIQMTYSYTGSGCPKGTTCTATITATESDVSSKNTQALYGVKEEWVDLTGIGVAKKVIASAVATNAAQIYLKKVLAATNADSILGEGATLQPNSLTLTLWGYQTTLTWRKIHVGYQGKRDIGTLVSRTLDDPYAQFFNTQDLGNVPATTEQITFNLERRFIWIQDWIQGVLLNGNGSDFGYLVQIWEDRTPFMTVRPAAPQYFSNSEGTRIYDKDHKLIPPHLVRAGSYISYENVNEALDAFPDVLQRNRIQWISRTVYDDIAETISLPQSDQTITPEILLALTRRSRRKNIV